VQSTDARALRIALMMLTLCPAVDAIAQGAHRLELNEVFAVDKPIGLRALGWSCPDSVDGFELGPAAGVRDAVC
jgi:hypothetical protein